MDFDYIYGMMSGFFTLQDDRIKNLYDGECGSIYREIWEARERIAPQEEHEDLMIIVNGYEKMMRLFSEYAYFLGKRLP